MIIGSIVWVYAELPANAPHMQWKTGGISKQPDKVLWLHTAFFGKQGFAKLIRSIGFKVQDGHVVQDKCA